MAPEKYKHRPLSFEREIRIIELHPALTYDADVVCSLRTMIIDDHKRHPYEALSYVWGSKTRDVGILCEGRTIKVTENCVSALRQLRSKVRKRKLWIDAISINQDDKSECGHQVKMMGEIYSSARQVLIWTGNQWKASLPLLFLTKCLVPLLFFQPLLYAIPLPDSADSIDLWDLCCKKLAHHLSAVAEAWKTSEWPHRVWTLQEMNLAKRFEIIHGRCKMPSDILSNWMFNMTWENKFESGDAWIARGYSTTDEFGSSIDITWLVRQVCRLQAMDPRDRVFALYSILKHHGVDMPAPDYRKSMEEIYTEATMALIVHDRTLEFNLVMRPHTPNSSTLPSWVPDLRDPDTFDQSTSWGSTHRLWKYKAARYSECDLRLINSRRDRLVDLPLNGHVLGTVCTFLDGPPKYSASSTAKDGKEFEDWVEDVVAEIVEVEPATGQKAPNLVDAAFSIVYALCPPWTSVDPLAPEGSPSSHKNDTAVLLGFLCRYFSDGKVPDFQFATSKIFKDTKEFSDPGGCIDEFRTWIGEQSQFRDKVRPSKFFTLDSGLFGLGYPALQPGDVAAIVAGFKLPIVLRRIGSYWHFVGAAFVPGAMYGELWPDLEDEDEFMRECETFVLR